jgi:hypothetical protein
VRWTAFFGALFVVACGGGFQRFPLADPMTIDPDREPFRGEPEEYVSPFAWDGADQMLFRPVSNFFAVDPAGRAANVNAVDEIPDSSWFTNRIGTHPMTPEEAAFGPCAGPEIDPNGPWTVTGAKPNGENPGFLMETADGTRYLVKFDGTRQPERATAADVIGTRLFHAFGYFSPCNRIVFFDRSILQIDPEAESEDEDGDAAPMTQADLDKIFERAGRLPDGRYRGNASRFIDARPIGPWQYEGTRGDDPNDVIDHEDRRELRGMYVLSAWLNHFDSREQNSLAGWVEVGEDAGWVRHYVIDFGDCLGSLWDWEGISRRLGHASYLDFGYVAADFLTLGTISRPWDDPPPSPVGPSFGYFDVDSFDPDDWRPGYPNPAYSRAQEDDLAWAARIIARIEPAHVRAIVETAHLADDRVERRLLEALLGRREKLLERYLGELSPLTDPRVSTDGAPALCLRDLAVDAGVVSSGERRYGTRAWTGEALEPREDGRARRLSDGSICVALPATDGASESAPHYLVIDVTANGALARVHLYQVGASSYRVVGLERPSSYDALD